ncbi:MAG: glycosyltransferase [Muribaculaceae bacterium]|nr:glycosyltransferase [Muribaculaceae bacterium]
MTLQVLISTLGADGIQRVGRMRLPLLTGISYLVSWQESEGLEVPLSLSSRADVTVFRLDGVGLSRNRNNCLDHWTADIALIADDDLDYCPEGLLSVVEMFERCHDLDIATFRHIGSDNKTYPPESCSLVPMPKGYYYTSVEIALRRNSGTLGLRFDTDFGLGSDKYLSGEEDVFMLQAEKAGLNIRFFPIDIAVHYGLSTGSRRASRPGEMAAWGAVVARRYPVSWVLRVPLKVYREWHLRRSPFFKGLFYATSGAIMSLFSGRSR